MPAKLGVLLLHGLTGVPSEMRPVEKALQKLGVETLAPTLAGHGGTNDELLAATWQDWINSAQTALDDLSKRVDQVVICGLSMGASIGSILASANPRVSGLIMLSPTMFYDSPEIDTKWHLRMYKSKLVQDAVNQLIKMVPAIGRSIYWSETAPYGLRDERLQRQITKAIEAAKQGQDTKFGLFRTYFISLSQMTYITAEFKRTAGNMKCPALVVSSLEDTLVSLNNPAEAYALLGTKDKSLVMLTGCDHVMTLDLKRNFLCGLIGEFLDAVAGLPAGQAMDDMEFSLELHNRVNPLSNIDWTRLAPDAPPLPSFVSLLQARGVHEQQCHALVARRNNQPCLLIPLIVESDKSLLVGVPESVWRAGGQSPNSLTEAQWAHVERATQAFCRAHKVKRTRFLDEIRDTSDGQKEASLSR